MGIPGSILGSEQIVSNNSSEVGAHGDSGHGNTSFLRGLGVK